MSQLLFLGITIGLLGLQVVSSQQRLFGQYRPSSLVDIRPWQLSATLNPPVSHSTVGMRSSTTFTPPTTTVTTSSPTTNGSEHNATATSHSQTISPTTVLPPVGLDGNFFAPQQQPMCELHGYVPYFEMTPPSIPTMQQHYPSPSLQDVTLMEQLVFCHPQFRGCFRPGALCQWSPRLFTTICCIPEGLAWYGRQSTNNVFNSDSRTAKIIREAQLLTNLLPLINPPVPPGSGTTDTSKPGEPKEVASIYDPIIQPLKFGDVEIGRKPGSYRFPSTVTWIRDTKDGIPCSCDIIVDTGLSSDKNAILGCLAANGRRPEDIEIVVITHGHPDHFGNMNLFPNAKVFFQQMEIDKELFHDGQTSFIPSRQICDNSALYLTPGHTSGDLSLVVKKAQGFGTVAIVGDLFSNEKDLSQPELWKQFSFDTAMQETNRKLVLCIADYIIPGHGKTFAVTKSMKESAACQSIDAKTKLVR